MKPVLCHISALEYWRSVRVGSRSFLAVDDPRLYLDEPPRKGGLAEPGPWWLARPLHVLVSKGSVRRTSSEVVCHVESAALPVGSVLDTQNGFCVCSPELCFVQMAAVWGIEKLIQLGFELCGTYDTTNGDVRECAPLTTVDRLDVFLASLGPMHGKKNASYALRYVANNSASPRETALAMLLCLPYRMGGYGIPMPQMNCRVDLGKRERRIAGRNYLVCDLYWPEARLDVEYDGGDHVEVERMAKDSMRRDALVSMGITSLSVTKQQIDHGGSLNGIAHVIAERVGKRLRYKDPEFTRVNMRLHRELLGR